MNNNMLIVIPTFNRNELLNRSLTALLPELPMQVRLVILDNNSPTKVKNSASALLSKYHNRNISIIRNKINVGGNGNILRAFEVCETKFLWILGDDDVICSGAIARIIDVLTKNPDAFFVNFSTKGGYTRSARTVTKGRTDFIESGIDDLGQIMFISSSIFNARRLRDFLSAGYHYAFTTLPHIITLFTALKSHVGAECVLSDDFIVEVDHTETDDSLMYSCHLSAIGLPALLLLDFDKKEARILKKHISWLCRSWLKPRSVYFSLIHEAQRPEGAVMAKTVFSFVHQNLYGLDKLSTAYFSAFFWRFMLFIPRSSFTLVALVYRYSGREIYRTNFDRL